MSQRIRIQRGTSFLQRDPISISQSRYALLNTSNTENQQNELQPNYEVNTMNKKGRRIKIKCDTPQKKRLHPACVHKNDPDFSEKQRRREEKIKRFFQQYHERVGTLQTNPTYQNNYVQFVKNIRNDPDQRWIYESYLYAKDKKNESEESQEYLYNRNKQTKTQRQQTHLRGMFSGLKVEIENAYKNPLLNEPYISNIQKIFQDIGLIQKIDFNFHFEIIKIKLEKIRKKLVRYPQNMFINETIIHEMIKGEKLLDEIFAEHSISGMYRFLTENNILNHDLIYEYHLQFTHSYREAATYHLVEWVNMYKNRIDMIFYLLLNPESSYLQNPSRETLLQTILQFMILKPLEKYLFFTNYGLNHHFEYKEEILAISFEDFYYLHLKQNILFILSFLECLDIKIPSTIMNQGAQGFMIELEDGNIMKVSQDKIAYEKTFFEFFKQCCIYQLIPNHSVPSYQLIIGPNICGVKMKKINGLTYLRHYIKFIFENKDQLHFENLKYHENYHFLQKINEIIRECQQYDIIHRDLNIRNIMIDQDGKLYLIDFDYTILSIHHIYILNYRKQLSLENIFEKKDLIELSPFAKSIDLFRILIHYFVMYFYFTKHELQFLKYISRNNTTFFKQNPDIFSANTTFIDSLRNIFYGTLNSIVIQEEGQKAFLLSNEFKLRHRVYLKCISKSYWRDQIKKPFYKNWIQPFIPENFSRLLSKIPSTLPSTIYLPKSTAFFSNAEVNKNPPIELYRPPQYNKTKSPILNLPSKGGKKKNTKKKKTTKRKS